MSIDNGMKNALVTGGTDGIGKQIAIGLAREGCRVVIVGRNEQKGSRVAAELRWDTGNRNIEFLQADLSLMSEANRVAEEVASRFNNLKYLVHSAGTISDRWELTSEGVESNFAINYLSRFVLTQQLLPLLTAAGEQRNAARIVIINGAAQSGTINFDDVNLSSNFGLLRMVGQSCRANDVFTLELARRLASTGPPRVTVTCLKMGVVKTNIRKAPGFPWWMKLLVPLMMDPLIGLTPVEAADPALKLLLSSEYEGITGALYLMIRKFRALSPLAEVVEPEIGRKLWNLSEQFFNRSSKEATGMSLSVADLVLKGERI